MGTLADNFYPDGEPISGYDAMLKVREETDTVLLSFSAGKDSICAWLAVREVFPNIVPYHMCFVPDLEFMERRLQYYEQVFGQHILRITDPNWVRMLNNLIWQPPQRAIPILSLGLPDIDYDFVTQMLIDSYNLPQNTFTAVGVRAADSMKRRAATKVGGPINWARRTFWPVWDVSNDTLLERLQENHIRLSMDYMIWGTSFDGLQYPFLKAVQEHYPDDYQRILEWFPLAELEIMRYNLAGGTYDAETEA